MESDWLADKCIAVGISTGGPPALHLCVVQRRSGPRLTITNEPPVAGHRHSIDVLMTTAAWAFGRRLLGVIMTGMVHDGVEGCRAIKAHGGYVLGQGKATSDVYGMNKAVWLAGCVDRQFPLPLVAAAIGTQIKRLWRPRQPPPPTLQHHAPALR